MRTICGITACYRPNSARRSAWMRAFIGGDTRRGVGDGRVPGDQHQGEGRVGGLSEAVAIHDLLVTAGVPVWCGGMLETGVGHAGNLALASLPRSSCPATSRPLSATTRMTSPSERFALNPDSTIDVPTGPGLLGVTVDRRALARFTRASLEIRESGHTASSIRVLRCPPGLPAQLHRPRHRRAADLVRRHHAGQRGKGGHVTAGCGSRPPQGRIGQGVYRPGGVGGRYLRRLCPVL